MKTSEIKAGKRYGGPTGAENRRVLNIYGQGKNLQVDFVTASNIGHTVTLKSFAYWAREEVK